jgi:membrane-bound lytic murein transglycosylase D
MDEKRPTFGAILKSDSGFMRRFSFILIWLLAAPWLCAEDQTVSISDIIQGVEQFTQDNLDTNVLNALPQVDDEQARKFLRDIETQFKGDYVVDLAALRQTAQTALPLLASQKETQPYAAWLKSQMAYLEMADEIRITNLSPTTVVANPSPQKERELWAKKVSVELEPWPGNAKLYVPQLKSIFIAQKVPAALVWVAEVESAFDRRAESPAGAAGLFQLMPDTAKHFGLSLWPFDQRFQLQPSATASAQYLKKLHDHFGDWRLTLAAYNAGEGRVQKLLDRYKTKNYDDISSHLPAETQMYVPRVEAIIKQREGVNLEDL